MGFLFLLFVCLSLFESVLVFVGLTYGWLMSGVQWENRFSVGFQFKIAFLSLVFRYKKESEPPSFLILQFIKSSWINVQIHGENRICNFKMNQTKWNMLYKIFKELINNSYSLVTRINNKLDPSLKHIFCF